MGYVCYLEKGFSSTDTLAATHLAAIANAKAAAVNKTSASSQAIFPEIQLRDASMDETYLLQFMALYERDALILQSTYPIHRRS